MSAITLPVDDEVEATAFSETSALLSRYKRAPKELLAGEGVELIDSDGKRYLDFASGIAVNALGYGDPGIARAISESLGTGLIHASNLYRTAPGEQLASKLVDPQGRRQVMTVAECAFGYRDSVFKRSRDRWVITSATFASHEPPSDDSHSLIVGSPLNEGERASGSDR